MKILILSFYTSIFSLYFLYKIEPKDIELGIWRYNTYSERNLDQDILGPRPISQIGMYNRSVKWKYLVKDCFIKTKSFGNISKLPNSNFMKCHIRIPFLLASFQCIPYNVYIFLFSIHYIEWSRRGLSETQWLNVCESHSESPFAKIYDKFVCHIIKLSHNITAPLKCLWYFQQII